MSNGNVPYYAIHKTLAGLLDVYRWIGDSNAKVVLLAFAGWVDTRTSTGRLLFAVLGSVPDVNVTFWAGEDCQNLKRALRRGWGLFGLRLVSLGHRTLIALYCAG